MAVSFADLMKLEKIDQSTFRSTAQPFSPRQGRKDDQRITYGGHVYAQAVWAAAHTVAAGFTLHEVTGHFILGGMPTVPFVYNVMKLRDGRSYCSRIVNVTQAGGKGICFTCTCSFKTEERNDIDVQDKVDLWQKYDSVLRNKIPSDFETVPGMDLPWYWKMRKETGYNDEMPGLDSTKADMSAYNDSKIAFDKRQLIFYRAVGEMKDVNLHLCAHLYASDRNSLFSVANHFEVGDIYSQIGSLSHTVIFHSSMKEMLFGECKTSGPQGDWFCKEDWTTRIASGRGMFHSRVWSPTGSHIATIVQDGLLRLTKEAGNSKI